MYKIFIPEKKYIGDRKQRPPIIRGYWLSSSGVLCKDFLRYKTIPKITDKILSDYKLKYKQEAIFFEVINNLTGNKLRAICYYNKNKKEVYEFWQYKYTYCDTKTALKKTIKEYQKDGIINYTIEKRTNRDFYIFAWIKEDIRK